jgi:sialate O-acetylesterase
MSTFLSYLRRVGAITLLASAVLASAEVKLPAIFGNHMVLQSGQSIPVWGTAGPGEKVQVTLGKQSAATRADASGQWRVNLKPVAPSSIATTLTITGTNTITYSDVLVGDVWLASGQSNMSFDIRNASTGAAAILAANHPTIRLFTVPRKTGLTPLSDLPADRNASEGVWIVCSPETLGKGFSAVAYFFGRDIQQFTGNPVGLIHSSWGGTPAEAWTSFDYLKKDPDLAPLADKHTQLLANYDASVAAYPQTLAAYQVKEDEWKRVTKPANDAAMQQWQQQAKAAAAAGQPEPARPRLQAEPSKPDLNGGQYHPTALFNGMIAPLIPYAIKGAIWYQGEANSGRAAEYRILFPRMIESWREKWGEGDFPFLYVQLPNYESPWSLTREAQADTLSLPNTGMAVTIDIGTVKNIHPPYKEIVGARLALVAEHVAYGKDLVYTGPVYKSMKVEKNAIRIAFDHVGGGLTIGPTPVSGPDITPAPTNALVTFTVAGEDKRWLAAQAHIDGDTVVVSSPDVAHPVAVRYGWETPPICNLYNKEGLPAAPFRSDAW